DVRRALAVPDGASRGIAGAGNIGWIGGKHTQACVGVRDDARERLIDFVGNRSGEDAKAHGAGRMREFRSQLVERFLRKSTLSDVEHRAENLQLTITTRNAVGECEEMLDAAIRHLEPDFIVKITAPTPGDADLLLHQLQVERVDA